MASYLKQAAQVPGFPVTKQRTYDSQGGANSGVVFDGPCYFGMAICLSIAASGTLYLMLFDSATVPGGGAIPIFQPIRMTGGSAGGPVVFQPCFAAGPYVTAPAMLNGLSWAASTTAASLTLDTTSSLWPTILIF